MTDREQLYGLPLDRFIAERGELAKQLRRDGDRERASAVASLRKPSIGAWAVNQLVRTQRRDIKALFDAGDRLQKAQAQLLAGRADGRAVRDAVERERTAVDKLIEAARGLLSADGHELTPATLERVAETLHAAALDEQARSQVEDGCLERELRHVGLGAGGDLVAPRAAPAPEERRDRDHDKAQTDARKAQTDARKAQTDARKAQTDARKALAAARKAEADTRRTAERAERELQKAHARRDHAASTLAEAEQALADARSRAGEATRAHERARRAREQLEN